ncbi:MAG TPA: hypothetical protein VKB57_16025 [Acidimicrobiales bacterium]|nr:hypothetical protein [Acidimicrobiales bacterium]
MSSWRLALLDLLRTAEGVLAATGEAVALCPVYGDRDLAARA